MDFYRVQGNVSSERRTPRITIEKWMLFISNDGRAVLSSLNFQTKSVVIIDNTKYNSRQTDESRASSTAWREGQIRDWLLSESKPFDPKDTKPILIFLYKKMFLKNWQKSSVLLLRKTSSWFDYLSSHFYWERHCFGSITCRLTSTGKDIVLVRLPVVSLLLGKTLFWLDYLSSHFYWERHCLGSITCRLTSTGKDIVLVRLPVVSLLLGKTLSRFDYLSSQKWFSAISQHRRKHFGEVDFGGSRLWGSRRWGSRRWGSRRWGSRRWGSRLWGSRLWGSRLRRSVFHFCRQRDNWTKHRWWIRQSFFFSILILNIPVLFYCYIGYPPPTTPGADTQVLISILFSLFPLECYLPATDQGEVRPFSYYYIWFRLFTLTFRFICYIILCYIILCYIMSLFHSLSHNQLLTMLICFFIL